MFEENSIQLSCAWDAPFPMLKDIFENYFKDWSNVNILYLSDDGVKISTDMADISIINKVTETEVFVESPFGYEDIASISLFFEKLNNLMVERDASYKITKMFARYSFDNLELKHAADIMKLSYTWDKYNFAFTKADNAEIEFKRVPKVVVDTLNRNKYTLNFDSVKTLWLLEVHKPIVDLSDYFVKNQMCIKAYLGKDITMLDTMLRYYLYFFAFAEKFEVHIRRNQPQNETAAFQVKFRNIVNNDPDTKQMKRRLYACLTDL